MMNNIPEVKPGLIAVSRDCFPIRLSESRRAAIAKAYGEGLYTCPVTVENETDALKALPAETVPDTAYARMFDGCTSLVNAPALPAMSLSEYCYSGMFTNCTSLTEAPALRATALKFCCYSCMFQGCTALRSVPALPAYELADGCYYYMFSGCSAIKLSETETEEYTIPYSVPILQDVGDVGIEAVSGMFENTGGTFTGTPEPAAVYYLHTSNSIVY